MSRKSARPNIKIEKIYPKELMEWNYEALEIQLNRD